jgi:hypothetical protein
MSNVEVVIVISFEFDFEVIDRAVKAKSSVAKKKVFGRMRDEGCGGRQKAEGESLRVCHPA